MKFRFATSALVFLVAMTMATGAFAQGIFTLSAGSESRGRSNGHAELAGGITLFLENGSIATDDEGAIKIDYGVPITNAFGVGAIEVDLCGTDGETVAPNVAIDADEGTITLTVNGNAGPGTPPTVAISCTATPGQNAINIDGVRVSLVGSGLSSLEVSVNVSGDVRLGDKTATVIDAIVDPLTDEDVDVAEKVTVVRHTGEFDDPANKRFKLVVTEPHNDSFDGSQLELTFSGLPEDVNVVDVDAWVTTKKIFDDDDPTTMPAAPGNQVPVRLKPHPTDPANMPPVGSNGQTAADKDGEVIVYLQTANRIMMEAAMGTAGDDDFSPEIVQGGILSSSTRNVVIVTGTIEGTDDDDLLPIDLTVDATVDLGPTGDEEDTEIPRFESNPTTAVTVIESSPSRTTLKAPFVTNDGTFETGVAVSNMSSGGNAQPGAIMLDLYVGGTKMSYKTSASSPGTGLNANGMLEPGSTWSVLLSEVFPGNPGNGYMTITTDFTGGDANVFISDFAGFSVTGTVRPPK
jgi:hypothetical protein